MELNKYQEQAMTTCMESSNNFAYMFNNLLGEVGELIEKVNKCIENPPLAYVSCTLEMFGKIAKRIRKEPESEDTKDAVLLFSCMKNVKDDKDLQKECGDILWQLAGLCTVMGWSLEDIAQQNLDKLASRQKRNVIGGNGDNR